MDFDKCHNLSKRNVKLILKILSDLGLLKGSSNQKTLYSTRSYVNWAFFGTRGPVKRSLHSRFKMVHSCQKRPNLRANSLNKLLFLFDTLRIWEFSSVWTDFDKFDNLSKRNVKLILKIFSDMEPLKGSSNKKTLY
jgi:hypothetical protein